jgi:Ni/Co efflux regulator RcnB
MFAARSATTIPPALLAELRDFLRLSGSNLSPADVIAAATRQWMAAARALDAPERGYQWKALFLPEGTRVRMHYGGRWFYGEVTGDRLEYQGEPVSPSQMAKAVAGDGRNAWRDLWLRRPGEKNWSSAERLRRALQSAKAEPASPMQAMQAAASSMSQALHTALTLVEHVKHEVENSTERRIPKHRRRADYEMDDYHAD